MSQPEDKGGGASRTTMPAAGSSAATDISLREHLASRLHESERRIDERDRYLREADQRFQEERDLRYKERREDDRRLLDVQRKADQLAIELQRQVDQKHFAHLNEAAARSIEERAHFASRELVDALKETVVQFKEEINVRLGESSGRSSGISTTAAVIVTVMTLGISGAFLWVVSHNHTSTPTPIVVTVPTTTTPAK